MEKTITGQELLKILKVNRHDLALLVFSSELNAYYPNDLTSVNESFKEYIKELIYYKKRRGIYAIAKIGGCYEREWKDTLLECQREILPPIIEQIPELLFFMSEVEEYQIAKGDKPMEPSGIPTSQRLKTANFFTRKGNFWEIGYEGKVETVNGVDGMHYIALLIDKPSLSRSCSELYQLVSGQTRDITMTKDDAIAQGLKSGFEKQYIGNFKTKEICLKEYKELQDILPRVCMDEQEEIKEKMAKLKPYLNLKERNFSDPNDKKVQMTIRNRLTYTYKILNKNKMKELSKHLKKCIIPDGYSLVYNGAITWKIIF